MARLIQEADIDNRFNVQMKKVQDAIDALNDIVDDMTKPGSMSKPTQSQKSQVRYAAEDLKKLWERM
jgi:hypothetical protein